MDLLPPDVVTRLREALAEAGFDYDGVAGVLGPTAHAALARNETTPGMRVTAAGTALETLVRLWPLQAVVPADAAERALPGLVDPLCVAGLLERSVGSVRARVDVRPYAADDDRWWVVSDLTPGLDGSPPRVPADHVLGISAASSTLAQLTPRGAVDRALDLGTGSGVQALHLARHASGVVATDVNRRALAMARLNADLNGVRLDLREGDLYTPVRGESFDLVVANPPFVVSPGTGERLVYRDSGLPGDEMVRRVVTGAPEHLADGGLALILANWVQHTGRPWGERVAEWLAGTRCDAWVVQREVADPAEYVELWLRDAGHDRSEDYARRYDAWLGWFADQQVTGVGFGWLALLHAGRSAPSVRLEEWPFEVEQPLAREVTAWAERSGWLPSAEDAQLLAQAWRARPDVRQEAVGRPGAEDPEVIVLRQRRGMRRARRVDTVEAALVGASDGDLPAGGLFEAIATLLAEDPLPVAEQARMVRELLAEGFLEPPSS